MTIDTISATEHRAALPSITPPLKHISSLVIGTLVMTWRVRRTRRHLATLTEDQLRDIGLTAKEARQEVRRSLFLFVPHL